MIEDHLSAFPPSGSCVDDVETALTTAILQTAERVAPPGALRLPAPGWRGDTQAEAENRDGGETSSLEAAEG